MENNNFLKYLYLLTLIKIIPEREDSLYKKKLNPGSDSTMSTRLSYFLSFWCSNYHHVQYFTSVLLRSTGSERSKAGHEEMKTGEGNHVDSQLS